LYAAADKIAQSRGARLSAIERLSKDKASRACTVLMRRDNLYHNAI